LVLFVVACFDSSLLSCHFYPFTDVVRKSRREVTREVWKSLNRGCRGWVLRQKETKTAKTPFTSGEREPLFSLPAAPQFLGCRTKEGCLLLEKEIRRAPAVAPYHSFRIPSVSVLVV